jgi:hypothetical protein
VEIIHHWQTGGQPPDPRSLQGKMKGPEIMRDLYLLRMLR